MDLFVINFDGKCDVRVITEHIERFRDFALTILCDIDSKKNFQNLIFFYFYLQILHFPILIKIICSRNLNFCAILRAKQSRLTMMGNKIENK